MTSTTNGFDPRRLLVLAYALLWPPFLILASRKSFQVDVLGWWSYRAFAIVAAYATLLLVATVIVIRGWRTPSTERFWLARLVRRLRQSKLLSVFAGVAPVLLWMLVVGYLGVIRVTPTLPLIVSLLDLAALVAVWEISLAFSERPATEQRQLILRLSVTLFGLMIAFVLVETAAAVLRLGQYATWEINPKSLNVRFHTDDFDVRVVTNNQGLREPQEVAASHDGKYRIVVVGDSMTFGWGVESDESYPRVAETLLREKYGITNVEVINMGKPGANPNEYLRFIRQYASQFNPDLIVLGFLIGNDCPVFSPAQLESEVEVNERLRQHVAASQEDFVKRALWKSYLVRLLDTAVYRRLQHLEQVGTTGRPGPIFGEPNPLDPVTLEQQIRRLPQPNLARARLERLSANGWIDRGLNWRMNPWLLRSVILNPGGAADTLAVRPETETKMNFEWLLCEKLILEMKSAAAEMGSELVVLAIPNAHLVSPRWVRFLGDLGCDTNDAMTQSQVINDRLRDFCRRNGLQCIDPLDRFRKEFAAGQTLYLTTDDHMSPLGYHLLGEELATGLKRRIKDSSQ